VEGGRKEVLDKEKGMYDFNKINNKINNKIK